jgi:hypothetical protein
MITILLLLGVISTSTVGILILQAFRAPEGHEDGDGFHYTQKSAPHHKAVAAYKVKPAHSSARAAQQIAV